MGGRGGSGRSSAALVQVPVVDANAVADLDIRDAYDDARILKRIKAIRG
jgi:hypothetical protein